VIDLIAFDVPDLLRKIDGRVLTMNDAKLTLQLAGAPIETIEPDWRTRVLSLLSNPTIALSLMMVGIYGLFIEFSTPGVMAPGVIGAISLLLGLYGLHLLPVNWAGVGLLLLGAALMIAEVFLPTFGALGIGGVAAFILGGLMLIDADAPAFGVAPGAVVAVAVVSAALIFGFGAFVLRAQRRPVVSGREELIGATGEVSAVEADGLWVHLHGESWQARLAADSTSAAPALGTPVRVAAVEGLTLVVRPLDGALASRAPTTQGLLTSRS
jgi:membrane-bound serine protease (ClpP class)